MALHSFSKLRCIKNIFVNGNYLQSWKSSVKENLHRHLTTAYKCDDIWKQRFSEEFIRNIHPVEFCYELERKYKREKKLSPVDIDLFINRLDTKSYKDLNEEVEGLLKIMRTLPESASTMGSTPHAFVRVCLDAGDDDAILKVISEPVLYGVFLDHYLANVLMDHFIEKCHYTGAARVASHLMLQEDFGPPLTQAFCLQSCMLYILNPEGNEPWTEYNPKIEPEEVVKIRVEYVTNPYFDDHFDLKEPLHIVGKTLAWLSPLLKDDWKPNSEVLGWAVYEKWDKLEIALRAVSANTCRLHSTIVEKIRSKTEQCPDERVKGVLLELIDDVGKKSLTADFNLFEELKTLVSSIEAAIEAKDIENQLEVYKNWSFKRKKAVEEQIALYERREMMEQIEKKKKELQEKEELIFFFDNKQKLEMLLPKDSDEDEGKGSPKTGEEDYIPPEV